MRTALYILNFVLMIGLPIALGIFLARRYRVPWRLWLIGGVTFILSQVGHIPFNILVFNGVVFPPATTWPLPLLAIGLGLSAGLFEETARYLVYKFWIKEARTWRQGVMFGAGHGGTEAIIVGGLAALTTVQLFALQTTDLNTLGLPADQLAVLQQQLEAFSTAPLYATLLGAVERVWAMIFHIAAALLVLQAVRRRNLLWLLAAILWHTALNAVAVYLADVAGTVWVEVAMGVMSIISLAIIYLLRDPPAPEGASLPPDEPLPAPAQGPLEPLPLTEDALKETRYQ